MKRNLVSLVLFLLISVTLLTYGCSGGNDEAVNTYKQFMDYWIVQDYTNALPLTTGEAETIVKPLMTITSETWGKTVQVPPGGFGDVEGSRIKVISESKSDNTISLEIIYSASISWEGSTANPMSPKSWSHYNQAATLVKIGEKWKVASFSGEGIDD